MPPGRGTKNHGQNFGGGRQNGIRGGVIVRGGLKGDAGRRVRNSVPERRDGQTVSQSRAESCHVVQERSGRRDSFGGVRGGRVSVHSRGGRGAGRGGRGEESFIRRYRIHERFFKDLKHLPGPQVNAMLKKVLQPVKAKYGGMGLAKPSVYVNIADAEFSQRFSEVFSEHIDGWAGNSYSKAIKKEKQKGMLWKQRLTQKHKEGKSSIILTEELEQSFSPQRQIPWAGASGSAVVTYATKQRPKKKKQQQAISDSRWE
mmetsp:Transcript_13023/g.24861  ORF Transcript_13023/g.24861 Transcript_13023/m.24861 type:complete len:258 (-) Transcript_13023:244-1017(-)